jgi:hypothetical protein
LKKENRKNMISYLDEGEQKGDYTQKEMGYVRTKTRTEKGDVS